jgi:hypothetical protein
MLLLSVPRNLEEWFAELEKKLSKKEIAYFKSLKEDEIVRCHHTLGRWIRNNWELGIGSLLIFFN